MTGKARGQAIACQSASERSVNASHVSRSFQRKSGRLIHYAGLQIVKPKCDLWSKSAKLLKALVHNASICRKSIESTIDDGSREPFRSLRIKGSNGAHTMASDGTRTILVVEDDDLLRTLASDHLRDHGYRVLEASTATEAMSVVSTDADVSLIFSDVSLPGAVGGLSLATWLNNHHPAIPLLLTSGVPPIIPILKEERVVPFIAKPYDFSVVARRIAEMVKPRDGPDSSVRTAPALANFVFRR